MIVININSAICNQHLLKNGVQTEYQVQERSATSGNKKARASQTALL